MDNAKVLACWILVYNITRGDKIKIQCKLTLVNFFSLDYIIESIQCLKIKIYVLILKVIFQSTAKIIKYVFEGFNMCRLIIAHVLGRNIDCKRDIRAHVEASLVEWFNCVDI